MTNQGFLNVLSHSFNEFLHSGTSRSTAKLKPLHGAIARDIAQCFGADYSVVAQGLGEGKEALIQGRYVEKRVDITICRKEAEGDKQTPVAGIAVKFVMQNYAQNSNNYFENMLGETANIRAAQCPYFQIFIVLDRLPYYKKETKRIVKWEHFTEHYVEKYVSLSKDNIDTFFHTPNKTLLYVVHVPDNDDLLNQRAEEYMAYYAGCNDPICVSAEQYPAFGSSIIMNDYELFREKVYHSVMAQ